MNIIIFITVFVLVGLLTNPSDCLSAAANGLSLCFNTIVPCLFPFFVCSKLLVQVGAAQKIGDMCRGIMRPIFNLPGSAGVAFVLGLLSGYPVGAQCGVDLYENNLCTKAEAERIICFCNNSGPLFIIGSIGTGLLRSPKAGIIMYIIHVLSALTLGILLRFYKRYESMTLPCAYYRSAPLKQVNLGAALSYSVSKAVELILYVSGFIVFFNVLIAILEHYRVIAVAENIIRLLGISQDLSNAIAVGFFEITSGVSAVANSRFGNFKIVLASVLLAWSGVSVILQVSGILSKTDLSPRIFIAAKAVQGIIAGVYAMVFILFMPQEIEACAVYNTYTGLFAFAFSLKVMCIGIAVLALLAFVGLFVKRRC
ncbi:MAG: hypothetical protein GX800_12065 [Clostridiaceae bacterium]|nr:hypothetical protein [Clostridiaceae bacterium]